jgi:AraC family transcriptional regulator of adaptative response/methylated-DNA-[protein]-cysteine methyltransferase
MKIFAVKTTRIYCREGCPARPAKPENLIYFSSTEAARAAGFRACKRCKPDGLTAAEAAVAKALSYIETHVDEKLTLPVLAGYVGVSPAHFQRTFKRYVGVSPKIYVATNRSQRLKSHLQDGETVLNAAHQAGFPGQKQAYLHSLDTFGMTPGAYRRGGSGEILHYVIASTPLGKTVIAATARGIAAIAFGESDAALVRDLRREFPKAEIVKAGKPTPRDVRDRLRDALVSVKQRVSGKAAVFPQLDLRGSAFQRKVWRAIQRVRSGKTSTYAQIARAIGEPKAARAVARACATNRLALVIPCHRILRSDGTSGYRWGADRKNELLRRESKIGGPIRAGRGGYADPNPGPNRRAR